MKRFDNYFKSKSLAWLVASLLAALVAGCGGGGGGGGAAPEPGALDPNSFEPGQLIVGFQSGTTQNGVNEIATKLGASVIQKLGSPDAATYVMGMPVGQELAFIPLFKAFPEVRFAEPNFIVNLATDQALVSTNGDQTKYVGSWSSCMLQTNEWFKENNISFSSDGADLVFTPAIGIVGSYYDAGCTQAVPGEVIAITPIRGLRFNSTQTVTIAPQSSPQFTGTADELPDLGQASFKFAGFSPDYKIVWFSSTSSFDGVVVRYDKQ